MFSSSLPSLNRNIGCDMYFFFFIDGAVIKARYYFLYSISITWSWTLMPSPPPLPIRCVERMSAWPFNVYKVHKWIIKIEFINWALCVCVCVCQSRREKKNSIFWFRNKFHFESVSIFPQTSWTRAHRRTGSDMPVCAVHYVLIEYFSQYQYIDRTIFKLKRNRTFDLRWIFHFIISAQNRCV